MSKKPVPSSPNGLSDSVTKALQDAISSKLSAALDNAILSNMKIDFSNANQIVSYATVTALTWEKIKEMNRFSELGSAIRALPDGRVSRPLFETVNDVMVGMSRIRTELDYVAGERRARQADRDQWAAKSLYSIDSWESRSWRDQEHYYRPPRDEEILETNARYFREIKKILESFPDSPLLELLSDMANRSNDLIDTLSQSLHRSRRNQQDAYSAKEATRSVLATAPSVKVNTSLGSVAEMEDWCNQNCEGRAKYVSGESAFVFEDSSDAAMFKMKWSS